MAMFRYGVLFPNSIVTATFGTWALSKGHKVTLYSPGGAHDIILKALVTDLTVLAVERSRLRNEPNDSLQVKALPNFLGCEILLVPNLDVMSLSDQEYIALCMNTFR